MRSTAREGEGASRRNFVMSFVIIAILSLSAIFLAWTHISLNREDLSMRLSRRSVYLQSQIDLMLEKRRNEEEFRKLVAQKTRAGGSEAFTKPCNFVDIGAAGVNMDKLSDENGASFAMAKEISFRFHTRYWLEQKDKWPKEPLPLKQKFLSFEPWIGGFNNIRMSLEMAAAMAMALGRTLVLPPRYRMYLRGTSSFEDYFDYNDLRRGFPTITYQEFRKLKRLSDYDNHGEDGPNTSDMAQFFKAYKKMSGVVALKEGHPLIKEKIGSQLVLCVPSCPAQGDPDEQWFNNIQYRLHPIDVSKHPDIFETPEILHVHPILLGHFYTLVWFKDPLLGARLKRTVRDHIHFKEEMFVLAERIIKALGGDFSYSCVHIRRNEFQFKEVWTPAEQIVSNIGTLFHPGETIYIATDELSVSQDQKNRLWNDPLAMSTVKTDHAWFKPMFEAWGGREKVKFWSDFYHALGLDKDVRKIWIGSVESIVCSRARAFVGTQKSTFSGYIHRMRGYMRDVGQKEYLEAQNKYPNHYYHSLVGPSWSRFSHGAFGGGHPYWGREYKEAWEGVDNPFY